MNIKKIINMNEAIKRILPKTYPRPKLILFDDEQVMLDLNEAEQVDVFAVYNPNVDAISISIERVLKVSEIDLVKILLHEYAHAMFGHRYGFDSTQYFDERQCDLFASRWSNKLGDVIGTIENSRFCGWRNEEVEYLKLNFGKQTKDRMVKRLDRSWDAIRSKARSLGLKRNK